MNITASPHIFVHHLSFVKKFREGIYHYFHRGGPPRTGVVALPCVGSGEEALLLVPAP